MSVAFNGEYSVDIFNAMKRYQMQFQKGVALADSELRELNDNCYSLTRQLVSNNFSTGSTTNDGFKVVESTSNTNNFLIKGGDGTVNGAGVLFVDGYILFLRNDIEYEDQDNTGALTDDDFTETAIPALTTPGAPRTDEVYVDMYFAESSGDAGSEYQDADLFVAGVGSATANRVRQVQDIRVAQGTTVPASGTDGNGIYHWRTKIATLSRLNGNAAVTNAMITDDRTIITSIGDLSDFNPEQVFFGGPTGTIEQDSLFVRDAGTGNVGIGTDNPLTNVDILGSAATELTVRAPAASDTKISIRSVNATKSYIYRPANSDDFRIGTTSAGDVVSIKETTGLVGIGTTDPIANVKLDLRGVINIQDGSDNAILYKPDTGGSKILIRKGTPAGFTEFIAVDNDGNTGIGTTNPQAKLHVLGDIVGLNDDTSNLGSALRRYANLYMASTIDYAANLYFDEAGSTKVTFLTGGNVGIGSTIPSKLFDIAGQATIDSSGNIVTAGNLEVNGTTTTLNTETTTTDMLEVDQDDNQNALLVKQTDGANTATVIHVENEGKGAIATFVGVGTGTAKVGIGTTNPQYGQLQIKPDIVDNTHGIALFDDATTTARMYLKTDGATDTNYHIVRGTSDTKGITINKDGLVGIGTVSNLAYLTSRSGTNSAPDTSGSSTNDVAIRAVGATSSALDIGLNGTSGAWIQARSQSNYATNYNLTLNQNGGNVGIGTIPDSANKLHLYKTSGNTVLEIESHENDANLILNSGTDGTVELSNILFRDNSLSKWKIEKDLNNHLEIYDYTRSANIFEAQDNGNMLLMQNGGNVGIGTGNPLTKLDVYGSSIAARSSTTPYIGAARDGGGAATLAVSNGSGSWSWVANTAAGDSVIQSLAGTKLHVGVGTTSTGAPTMTFAPANRVGIGTTGPSTPLQIMGGDVGIGTAATSGIHLWRESGTCDIVAQNGGDKAAFIAQSATHKVSLSCAGTVAKIGTTTNIPFNIVANDNQSISIDPNQSVHITGRVGINSAPTNTFRQLTVKATAADHIAAYCISTGDSGVGVLAKGDSIGGVGVKAESTNGIGVSAESTNGTALKATSSGGKAGDFSGLVQVFGKVGIGTTNPSTADLRIVGTDYYGQRTIVKNTSSTRTAGGFESSGINPAGTNVGLDVHAAGAGTNISGDFSGDILLNGNLIQYYTVSLANNNALSITLKGSTGGVLFLKYIRSAVVRSAWVSYVLYGGANKYALSYDASFGDVAVEGGPPPLGYGGVGVMIDVLTNNKVHIYNQIGSTIYEVSVSLLGK